MCLSKRDVIAGLGGAHAFASCPLGNRASIIRMPRIGNTGFGEAVLTFLAEH